MSVVPPKQSAPVDAAKGSRRRAQRISRGVKDLRPALFLQVFGEWEEKERCEFSKWQLVRYLLKDFMTDKKFLSTLLRLLDPLQRKDAVYYEMLTFKEETVYGEGWHAFSLNYGENSENEEFLKEWFERFDDSTKQSVILKLLRRVSDRHLFCLTKMIRWKLFELEECGSSDTALGKKDAEIVKTQQEPKKSKSLNRRGLITLAHLEDAGLSSPSKYFSNFVLFLPLSVTKKIFGHLDRPSILNCLKVSKGWRYLAGDVMDDKQSLCGCYKDDAESDQKLSNEVQRKNHEELSCLHKPYNLTVVLSSADAKRVIDFNEDVVAFTSGEKRLLTICREPFEFQAERNLGVASEGGLGVGRSFALGHMGTVKAILLFCSKGFVISCSYDATIRKWLLKMGRCLKIYSGHGDVVCCLSNHGDVLLSGSHDKSCKVWSIESGRCHQTFIHEGAVTGASVYNVDFCITSTSSGTVRMFSISEGNLLKKFQSHEGPVLCLRTSRRFVSTSSVDCKVKVWSFKGQGKEYKRSLVALLEHPRGVQCMELKNKELITGCDDGRIRIWSLAEGACSRILWGNRYGDPILHLKMGPNRLLINTISSILLYDFSMGSTDSSRKHDSIFHGDQMSTSSGLKKSLRSKKSSSAPLPQSPPSSSGAHKTLKMPLSAPTRQLAGHDQ